MRIYSCAICGQSKLPGESWYLLAENRWEDKLKILGWDDRLAVQPGIHHACNSKHVQEMVVHWMVTGRLDYPFAQVAAGLDNIVRSRALTPPRFPVYTQAARPIGELAVHRESLTRVLSENPRSLNTILDALVDALERESPRGKSQGAVVEEGTPVCPAG